MSLCKHVQQDSIVLKTQSNRRLQQQDFQHIEGIHFLLQPDCTGVLDWDNLEPVTDTEHILNIILVEQDLQVETSSNEHDRREACSL